eukprot:gene16095-7448_t
MQLAKLSGVPDIDIKFIDESSTPHVHVASASKQHARQKAICKKSSDAGSMTNSGTEHDKAAMAAIDEEFSLFQKIEANEMCKLDTLIEQRMHIQRSMQEMLYQVIGDNLDLYIKVKHMTSENQNKSIHWFNLLGLPLRVTGVNLDNTHQQRSIVSMRNEEFIPDKSLHNKLLLDLISLVSRVIVDNIKAFSPFKNLVLRHIPHKYSKEMSMKSYEVPLGGDNLTEERAQNLKGAMADGEADLNRLGGILPRNEDWHAIRYMYKILYEAFFDNESVRDVGSMAYSMNLIKNTNARGNVLDKYNECKEFVNFETDALIITLTPSYFGLASTDVPPEEVIAPTVITSSKGAKIGWFYEEVKK